MRYFVENIVALIWAWAIGVLMAGAIVYAQDFPRVDVWSLRADGPACQVIVVEYPPGDEVDILRRDPSEATHVRIDIPCARRGWPNAEMEIVE